MVKKPWESRSLNYFVFTYTVHCKGIHDSLSVQNPVKTLLWTFQSWNVTRCGDFSMKAFNCFSPYGCLLVNFCLVTPEKYRRHTDSHNLVSLFSALIKLSLWNVLSKKSGSGSAKPSLPTLSCVSATEEFRCAGSICGIVAFSVNSLPVTLERSVQR